MAAAISGLASGIKDRLGTAELLLGTGALLIAVFSFLVFGFLLDTAHAGESAVLLSAVLLVIIGLERTEREGFGPWYRVALVLLGGALLLSAIYSLLVTLRAATPLDIGDWLGLLAFWIGGVLAGIGAWMTYRIKA